MQMTLNIPDSVVEQAEKLGIPVSELVSEAIHQIVDAVPPGFVRLGVSNKSRAEATASIREIARTHSLGGLDIKDLINEGRRC